MGCRSKCEVVNVLEKQEPLIVNFPTSDNLGASCHISRASNNKLKCNFGLRTMAVSFNNDRYQNNSGLFNCNDYTVRANIAVGGGPAPSGFVSSDVLHFDVSLVGGYRADQNSLP